MRDRRIAVILGDGQMAARCARLITERDDIVLHVLIHHGSDDRRSSHIEKASEELGIPHLTVGNVNDREAIEALNDIHPDIMFSINNWDVIRTDLLTIAGDGIINFHNGPLPEYRGVNVPSWAIINGEENHGVTWHFVTEEIDAGDIVASKSFPLHPNETAVSLILRCIETGLDLFPSILDKYVSENLEKKPQQGEGRYYSTKDSPNLGYLNFNQDFDPLSALVRGLSFRPFENQFTYPKIRGVNRTVLVSEISYVCNRPDNESWTCGEVRGIDDRGIVVCAKDCQVRLSGLMQEDLTDISDTSAIESCGVRVGSVLPAPNG